MEIERKWMVSDWPPNELGLPVLYEQSMRQGYINVRPTVRIREEAMTGGDTEYVLCFKSGTGLVRKEIVIPKVRRTYGLPDGNKLEVNHVDEGLPTEFWYAEIEYDSVASADNWDASSISPLLAEYLNDDVTDDPGQTMGAYWIYTRLEKH